LNLLTLVLRASVQLQASHSFPYCHSATCVVFIAKHAAVIVGSRDFG